MVQIAGCPDEPNRFKWSIVKNVFYRRIDSDPSLGKRSEDIMGNGAIWTSLADLTIISALFAVSALVLQLFGFSTAYLAVLGFVALALVSTLFQELATRRHIRMGKDQLDYIEQFFRKEVGDEIRNISA